MIRVEQNAAGESQVLIGLTNGWTIAVLPMRDDSALLHAWLGEGSDPKPGAMRVVSADTCRGDELVEFINQVAAAPAATGDAS